MNARTKKLSASFFLLLAFSRPTYRLKSQFAENNSVFAEQDANTVQKSWYNWNLKKDVLWLHSANIMYVMYCRTSFKTQVFNIKWAYSELSKVILNAGQETTSEIPSSVLFKKPERSLSIDHHIFLSWLSGFLAAPEESHSSLFTSKSAILRSEIHQRPDQKRHDIITNWKLAYS